MFPFPDIALEFAVICKPGQVNLKMPLYILCVVTTCFGISPGTHQYN